MRAMMSNKVTYAEIVEALSQKTGFSKQKSEDFTKALIAEVKAELQKTGKASITNFGSFKVKEVAERQGKNPQTGEPITIPAHKRVTFTPYKALREEVNAKYAHLESELIGEKEEKSETENEAVAKTPDEERSDMGLETEDVDIVEEEPKSFSRKERARGNNTGLIMVAVLILAVVALASAWFLLSTDEATQIVQQPPAEAKQEVDTTVEPDEVAEPMDETASTQEETQATEEVVSAEAESEEVQNSVEQVASRRDIEGNSYQVKADEWYWVIAEKVYGKSRFWPLIFQANRTVGDDPDKLYPSSGLEVPALEGTAENPTKSDYKRLSEASMLVAEAYWNAGKTEKADEYALFATWWVRLSK